MPARRHRTAPNSSLQGGGGGFVRGQVSGESFVFSVRCRNFRHEMFLRNLGHFLLLAHPPWRRRGLSRRCGQSVCSSRPFIHLAWQ